MREQLFDLLRISFPYLSKLCPNLRLSRTFQPLNPKKPFRPLIPSVLFRSLTLRRFCRLFQLFHSLNQLYSFQPSQPFQLSLPSHPLNRLSFSRLSLPSRSLNRQHSFQPFPTFRSFRLSYPASLPLHLLLKNSCPLHRTRHFEFLFVCSFLRPFRNCPYPFRMYSFPSGIRSLKQHRFLRLQGRKQPHLRSLRFLP